MVPRWRIFGDFLRPVFSASRVQHVSDLHLKFALRPQSSCVEVWYTSNLRRLTLGVEEKRKIEETTAKLECGPMLNVMVALPNIGGTLCSAPQSFADVHY